MPCLVFALEKLPLLYWSASFQLLPSFICDLITSREDAFCFASLCHDPYRAHSHKGVERRLELSDSVCDTISLFLECSDSKIVSHTNSVF